MSDRYEYDKIAELVECFEDLPQMMNRAQANQNVGTRFRVAEPNYSHNVTLALRNSNKFDPSAPENASQVERMAVQAKKVLHHLSNVSAQPIKIGKDLSTCAKLAIDKLSSLQKSGVDISKFYKQYDTQRTGKLSYKDFSDTLLILSTDIGREDAMLLANSLDKKKTGTVDYNNLLPALKDLHAKTSPSDNDAISINSRRKSTPISTSSSVSITSQASQYPPEVVDSPQRVPRFASQPNNNTNNNNNNNNNPPPNRRTRSAIKSEINTLTSVLDQLKSFQTNNLTLDGIELDQPHPVEQYLNNTLSSTFSSTFSSTTNPNTNINTNALPSSSQQNNEVSYYAMSQSYDTGRKAQQPTSSSSSSSSLAPPVISQSLDSSSWKQQIQSVDPTPSQATLNNNNTQQQQQQQQHQSSSSSSSAAAAGPILIGDDVEHLPLTSLLPYKLPPSPKSKSSQENYGTGRRFYYRYRHGGYSESSGETELIDRLNEPTAPYYVDPPPKSKPIQDMAEAQEEEMDNLLKRTRSSRKKKGARRSASAPPRFRVHQNSEQVQQLLAHDNIFPPSQEAQQAELSQFLTQLTMDNPCAQERAQLKDRAQRTQEIEDTVLENTIVTQLGGRVNNFRHILKKLDASHSGLVNYNEFKLGLLKVGIHLEPHQVNALFQKYSNPVASNTIAGGYSNGQFYTSGQRAEMIATSQAKFTPHDCPQFPTSFDLSMPSHSIHQGVDIEAFVHDLEEKTLERDLFPAPEGQQLTATSSGVTPATKVIPITRPAKQFAQESSSTRIAKQLLSSWQKLGSNPDRVLSLINPKHHGYLSRQELSDALVLMGNNHIQPYELSSLLQHVPTNAHDGKYSVKAFYDHLRDKVTQYETSQQSTTKNYLQNATTRYSPSYASQIVFGSEEEAYAETKQDAHLQKKVFDAQDKQWARLKIICQENYDKIFHAFHDTPSSLMAPPPLPAEVSSADSTTSSTAGERWAKIRNSISRGEGIKLAVPTYTNGSTKTGEKLANNVTPHCIAPSIEFKSLAIDSLAKELSLAGIPLAEQDVSCLTQHILAHKYNNNNTTTQDSDSLSVSSSFSSSAPASPSGTPRSNVLKTLGSVVNQEEKKLSMDEFCALMDIPVKKHVGLLGGDCLEIIPRTEREIRDEGIFQSARQAIGKERSTTLIPSMVTQSEAQLYDRLYGTSRRKYPQSYASNYERHSEKILDFHTVDDPMCFPHPLPSLREPFPPELLAAKRLHRQQRYPQHGDVAYEDDHSLGPGGSVQGGGAGGAGTGPGARLTAEALLASRLGTGGGSLLFSGGAGGGRAAGKRTDANRPRNTLAFPPFATEEAVYDQQSYQDDVRSVGTRESRRSLGTSSVVSQLSRYSAGSQASGGGGGGGSHRRQRAISAPPRNTGMVVSTNSNQGEAMRQLMNPGPNTTTAILRGGGSSSAKLAPASSNSNGNTTTPPPTTNTTSLEQGLSKWSVQALKDFYDKKQGPEGSGGSGGGGGGGPAGMTMGELDVSRDSTISATSYASASTGTHTTRRIPSSKPTEGSILNGRQALRQQYESKNGSSAGMAPFATDY